MDNQKSDNNCSTWDDYDYIELKILLWIAFFIGQKIHWIMGKPYLCLTEKILRN